MRSSRQHDQDILIAEYTLGLLTPQEATHVHTLMASDSAAAVTALKWEHHFLELVDVLEPVAPSAHVLQQVQAALGHAPSPPSGRLLRPASPAAPAPAQAPQASRDRTIGKPSRTEPTLSVKPNKTSDQPASAPTQPADTRAATEQVQVPASNAASREEARTQAAPPAASTSSQQAAAATAGPAERQTVVQPSAVKTEPRMDERRPGMLSALWNSPRLWRAVVLVLAMACAALALKPDPPLIHITETAPTQAAVLLAPGTSSTPGWVLTIDTSENVLLTPQVNTEIAQGSSVQLWTQNSRDPKPRSLGLIDINRPVIIKAELIGEILPSQIFEMTLEEQGGSATGQPTGPVLFIGRVVLFGSPEPTPQDAATNASAS